MKQVALFDLICEAKGMLLDREPLERDLIYAIAKLDQEERAAIILAYQCLLEREEDEKM